jgi:hypothetical protein
MKNLDFVIKKTAADLKLPEAECRKVIEGWWEEARSQVVNVKSTTLGIRKVGVITVSKLKIRTFISDTIRKIRNTAKSKRFSEKNKVIYIAKYKKRLRNALVQRNVLAQDYAEKFGNV